MAGFPIRSARRPTVLQRIGYSDADGSLRVSQGQVKEIEADRYFSADLDGSMGNSGSAVFDQNGLVVGMFSRAVGVVQRNATEYGHVRWVQVTARMALHGLDLGHLLPRGG
jgi:V8-like Glu-specific endopeptidase